MKAWLASLLRVTADALDPPSADAYEAPAFYMGNPVVSIGEPRPVFSITPVPSSYWEHEEQPFGPEPAPMGGAGLYL